MSGGAFPPRRDDGVATPEAPGATRGRVARDASRRHLQRVAAACSAADGLPPEAAAIRDQAMSELIAAVEQQDAFLDAAAHDLRNPLTAINGHVQLLQRRLRRAPDGDVAAVRVDEGLANIDVAVARLGALIDELLDRRHERGGA